MGITILIGAGAAIEIGGPTTFNITEAVCDKIQTYGETATPYIKDVAGQLSDYYNTEPNFEDIYQALEQIDTYSIAWQNNIDKKFMPTFGAFSMPKNPKLFESNAHNILLAKRDLITIVADMINEYSNLELLKASENKWYAGFWKKLNDKPQINIATLNYDTTIESIIKDCNQGFESVGDSVFKRFNPKKLYSDDGKTKLMHLHGAINFGYSRTVDINQFSLADDHEDLYLYPTYEEAKETWFARSEYTSQSGNKTSIGPIITGLSKPDKIHSFPYSYYNAYFANSILNNPALLVIGYSFGDYYINNIVKRMARIHGKNRRIVFIMKLSDKKNERSEALRNGQLNRGGTECLSMAFQEYDLKFIYEGSSPITSKDGGAKLYIDGFKNTIMKYEDEIIAYLLEQ